MNQTKPSNGPADVRLSATAAAVLDLLREDTEPLDTYGVYFGVSEIPWRDAWELHHSVTQTALRELIDAGLVVATDRDGETVYSLAPERPSRPYTGEQRDAVLDTVEQYGPCTAMAAYTHAVRNLMTATMPVTEILVDLVADGDVIREVRGDAYVYRLAKPPEPPLPTVSPDELKWLNAISDNEPLNIRCIEEGYAVRWGLQRRGLAKSDGLRYTLTDLGRRVLAAADKEADCA